MTASSPLSYVVFGVTGRTGAAAANALLCSGHSVRVAVRDAHRMAACETNAAQRLR